MSHDILTYDDLLRIVELIKSSEQFSEFRLKIGEVEIELRRRRPGGTPAPTAPSGAGPAQTESSWAAPADARRTSGAPRAEPPLSPAALDETRRPVEGAHASSAPAAPTWPPGSVVVRAPMVGTFYRSPEPGAPPFIEVGQTVGPDTTVCIIEVMKLMNSIPAGGHGVVTQVLVDNGAPVETNAPLIVIDPASK